MGGKEGRWDNLKVSRVPSGAGSGHSYSSLVPAQNITEAGMCQEQQPSVLAGSGLPRVLEARPASQHLLPLHPSCQPSGQLFRRPGHLLSLLLNSALQEDEPFRFKSLVTRSWFSYSLQLLACLKADHYRAATALAIPTDTLQPTPVHQEEEL